MKANANKTPPLDFEEGQEPEPKITTEEEAVEAAGILLALGGSFSDVRSYLVGREWATPEEAIASCINGWVGEDKSLSAGSRAVQRRRLQRQVRIAMGSDKVGDAVRAEAILARLDDQEAEIEAGKTTNEFEREINNRTNAEVHWFVTHGRWPESDEEKAECEKSDTQQESKEEENAES